MNVRPKTTIAEVLLTAHGPVSHHDPSVAGKTNFLPFNRRERAYVAGDLDSALPGAGELALFLADHPATPDVAGLLETLDFPEFAVAALVRLFLDLYNALDGAGLFSGMERYQRLETRLRTAAVRSGNLRQLWNRIVGDLQVPIHSSENDVALARFFTLPPVVQRVMLRIAGHNYRAVVSIARLWHQQMKQVSPEYALAAGLPLIEEEPVALSFADWGVTVGEDVLVLPTPTISSNEVRTQMVRHPAWLHLCAALGIGATWPGQGQIPPGVEALFVNGGNIRVGSKQPSNAHALAWQIRERYPSLDLLGGNCDSFDLYESNLAVAAYIVCRENKESLADSPAAELPMATASVFDLVDEVTHTRQATPQGEGQMIWRFETLVEGAQVVVRLALRPFTPPLTQGALVAAVQTYLDNLPTIGGQAARGMGQVRGEWLTPLDDGESLCRGYEQYLTDNGEELLKGIVEGTMGTQRVIMT